MSVKKMDIIRKILIGILIIVLLIIVEFLKPLKAEETKPLFHLGGYAGLNLNSHYASFTRVGEEYFNCCPRFETAFGTGYSFGGLIEFPLKDRLIIGARIGFSKYDGEFSPKEVIGNTEVREQVLPYETITITSAEVEHILDATLNTIGIEPYVGFNLFRGLHATAGFRLGYLMSPQFTQYEKLLKPENVTFTDGRRLRNDFYDQEIPESNAIQVHGLFGFGYDLPIGKNSFLTPEVKYYMPFTNISNVDWKASSFQFSAAVKFPIYPPEPIAMKDTVLFRDTTSVVEAGVKVAFLRLKDVKSKQLIVRTEVGKVDRTEITEYYEKVFPKVEDLAIDFQVFGVNADGSRQENPTVVIEEIETEEGFPLLPYIFFPQANSSLANSRMTLLTNSQTSTFQEQALPWNTMMIYEQMLNIVGKRLTDNPRTSITVTGTNNNNEIEKGNINLSLARAENVRDYLIRIWNIDPSRIRTESVNLPAKPTNPIILEGFQENSRVEISSNNSNILAPVYLKEILRKSNPPLIEIHPAIQTSAGIKDYTMSITQGDSEIRKFSTSGIPAKYDWNIEEPPVPLMESPAMINISATDNSDQKRESNKQITIKQKTIKTKREQIEGDYRVERYSLILFDFDKATMLDNHKYVLDYIKSKIMPNSLVTITGYADRTGTPEYNRDLARRRSEEVSKYFNLPSQNFTIKPVGSDELIFDNDVPEGRSYSRTVRIEIRTPVGGK